VVALKEKISRDMKQALKSGDKLRLSTLRLLLSEIRNAEIAKRRELNDEDVLEVIARELRKRRESISEFDKAGREDLSSKEKVEAQILEEYLPPKLSEQEIGEIISRALEESGAQSLQEMGKVMALVMPQVKGRADGKLVNEKVRKALEGKQGA
jgi:uncharacterized protein YqeY